MKSIPSPDECLKLLKNAGCSQEVILHCKAVRDIAIKMAKKTNADLKLVEAGALLHDIGRSKTHGIRHAVEGVKIAKKLELSDGIIKIIERHIGAGLSAEEAKKLGLPSKDYIPITLEEKIVCHADSLVDNNRKKPIEHEIERALNKGHNEYAKRLVILHKELSDLCGIDLNKI
jgi:tRNA (cytidine56-2'-O)-methyltransferase